MCEGQTLTFAELNVRANRVAHRLLTGARPDGLVGLCTERGLNMIVGMLAILKSGAAYLPLDPAYPQERIAFMLKDAHVRIVVTEKRLAGQLARAGVECLPSSTRLSKRLSTTRARRRTEQPRLCHLHIWLHRQT